MNELNSLECVLNGTHLVEAAAGTGKTYNIQNLVVRLLLEKPLTIENIAVVTFTEAAADELRSRLRKVINETCEMAGRAKEEIESKELNKKLSKSEKRALSLVNAAIKVQKAQAEENGIERSEDDIKREIVCKLTVANLDFDKAAVGTIHSFCQRLLKDFAFESGEPYALELTTNSSAIRDNFAMDAYRYFCYNGKYASFYSTMLSDNKLKELVKIKDSRPDIRIYPEAAGSESLEEVSKKLEEAWQNLLANGIDGYLDTLSGMSACFRSNFDLETRIDKARQARKSPLPRKCDIDALKEIRKDVLYKRALNAHKNTIADLSQNYPVETDLVDRVTDLYDKTNCLLRDAALEFALENYNQSKRKLNQITFDDILRKTRAALSDADFTSAVKKRLKAGIIDEFQDTDPVQWEIFKTLFDDTLLYLVGDPRQAIYQFRGGDITTYLAVRKSIKEENRHTLTTNYRSCPELLNQINICFREHASGFASDEIVLDKVNAPDDPVKPLILKKDNDDPAQDEYDTHPLRIVPTDSDTLYDSVADIIIDLLTNKNIRIPAKDDVPEREIRPEDITILIRNWNNGFAIKELLGKRNIPAIVLRADSVFTTSAAEMLQRVLTGILNVNDQSSLFLALTTQICGVSMDELAQENARQSESISKKCNKLAELEKLWQQQSFYVMFRKLLTDLDFDVEKRFTLQPGGLRVLTDLIQLGDLLHQESSRRNLAPQAVLDYLIFNRSHSSDQFPREQETDKGAVIITTEHKSKGLQYPIVLLPDWNIQQKTSQIYHDDNGELIYGKDDVIRQKLELIQEELRLAYVAVTRAEHACYILATAPGKYKLTPLNWLWYKRNETFSETDDVSKRLKECTEHDFPENLLFPLPSSKEYVPEKSDKLLAAQEMPKIPGPTITTSFSSMAPGHSGQLYQPPETDDKEDDEDDSTEDGLPPPEKQTDPLRRLKGKNFGLLLHGIMETVDFTASDDIIKEAVKRDILLSEPTEEEINYSVQVISNTLKLQLPGGPRVSEIKPEKRLTEMRFHFRFNSNLNKGEIRTAAAQYLAEKHEEKKDDYFTCHGGFLTGSIDLLFEHQGKYYILDWKSNLLPEYSPAMLKQSMTHSYYQMQYLIYLAAVIRLLKQRLNLSEEEAYEKIGGVYYVYMRGADPEHPENGVFFDRPEYSEISKITGLLK